MSLVALEKSLLLTDYQLLKDSAPWRWLVDWLVS